MPKLTEYDDLLADVRYDGRFHSIRNLIQPADPGVKEVADTLFQAPDFVAACQDFVNSFTTYGYELGDYWGTPGETMTPHCGFCRSTDTLVPTGDTKNGQPVYLILLATKAVIHRGLESEPLF